MNKEEWGKLYNTLHSLYYEFLISYQVFKTSKNNKIRETSLTRVHELMGKCFEKLSSNENSYKLIFGDREVNEMAEILLIEDFKKPQYFEKDMEKILDKIYTKT